jgi:hypothetical protein
VQNDRTKAQSKRLSKRFLFVQVSEGWTFQQCRFSITGHRNTLPHAYFCILAVETRTFSVSTGLNRANFMTVTFDSGMFFSLKFFFWTRKDLKFWQENLQTLKCSFQHFSEQKAKLQIFQKSEFFQGWESSNLQKHLIHLLIIQKICSVALNINNLLISAVQMLQMVWSLKLKKWSLVSWTNEILTSWFCNASC